MPEIRIQAVEALDIRFPTSDTMDGSDAMHRDPDYSAAYVTLKTNVPGLEGNGLAFTIGRGNELCVEGIKALGPLVAGRTLAAIREDFAAYWRSLTSDTQMRWVGPEKGVIHLATAAVVNAIWDLWAKSEHKPLWKLVCELPARDLVRTIDFRYITDALTPAQAIEILEANESGRAARQAELLADGFPAYTTSVGWLGYDDAKLRQLCRDGLRDGWRHFKMKVGANLEDDRRRAGLIRSEIGKDNHLMMDANQRWDVPQAIRWIQGLAEFKPLWIEEPTSPDDVLGHAAIARAIDPIGVATGEQCANRVLFKQMFQANALRFCQLDTCRLGGFNEVLAVLLLAKKFGVPVCPHAGGVGLCEHVGHVVMIDYARIAASKDLRIAEWVDHLHEHFVHPSQVRNAAYLAPTAPGYGVTMKPSTLSAYAYPHGSIWRERLRNS